MIFVLTKKIIMMFLTTFHYLIFFTYLKTYKTLKLRKLNLFTFRFKHKQIKKKKLTTVYYS